MIKKIFLLVSFFFTVFTINAQVCQNLDAGDDVNLDCENTSSSVDLTATVIVPNYKTTRGYTVGGELLCPSVTYDGSRTFIQTDDEWSDFVIDIPFTFCFYENQYDQILISGNGIVTFDLTVINQFSDWNTDPNDFLGTNGQQNWQTNAIFGAYHDMNSNIQPREDRISYKTEGVAPNRKFVVSFECFQFSCTTLLSKSQITLYESSNVIDVRIDEKPVCSAWNEGLAVVGIQNKSGTLSQTGREHGQWTPPGAGELWRFVPNGEDLAYTLTWYDEDGNILNSDDGGATSNNEETITVNPSITSTYTVEMTLEEQCNDSTVIVTDSVIISTPFNLDINSPLDIEECETIANPGVFDFNIDQTTFILNGIDPALVAISYHPTLIDAQNNTAPITVLNPYNSASTTIYVRVEDLNDPTCVVILSFNITVLNQSVSTFDYPTNLFCNDGVNPVAENIITAGGSFSIGNGGVIDATTGTINLSNSGLGDDGTGNFTVTYTTPNPCSTFTDFNITIELTNSASFDFITSVCIDEVNPIATNIATAGGVFTVDNGATINVTTGELDLSTTTAGTTYTIIYNFGGNCPSSTSQTVNVVAEDISTFDYPTNLFCNDDVNPIAGNIITAGGSFSIDNGGVINATTGEVNLSDSALGTDNTGVFIVTYTTPDPCSTFTDFNITIELTNDASFDYPSEICITDINPTATNIATSGGVFTVDNGASIAADGTLDLNTTVGTTYTITYSFIGNCPSSLSQTILINESPTANLPDSIIHSCNNGDGTANFDINTTTIEDEIINNQTDVTVTYHISQVNAESGSNAINFVPYAVLTGNDIWARIENLEGCFDLVNISDNFVVDQCFLVFPTGFTPNNDGENELFTIQDASDRYIGELYPNFEIWIYNRYGNQVYTGKNGDEDWNGKIDNSGNDLPAGTYFFGLRLNDDQNISHRGWIYLQR